MLELLLGILIGIFIGVGITLLIMRNRKSSQEDLHNAFKAIASDALRSNNRDFINIASQNMELLLEKSRSEFGRQAISETLKPLKERLERYDIEIKRLEQQRSQQYGGLDSQIKGLIDATNKLDKETLSLINILKRPEARGRLGEITLRRIIEMAGMQQYITFIEQAPTETDTRLRPDILILLPNKGRIVIDSKVSLKPLLDAYEEPDDFRRKEHIQKYHKAVKNHITGLSQKKYWKQFENSPDFVIMFIPGESFYFEAISQDPNLIEKAIEQRVIIVTPTTLLALLRTIAIGWQEHDISENAKNIASIGNELYERFSKFTEYYARVGKRLDETVKTYNDGAGSYISRLLPAARRLKDLSNPTGQDAVQEPAIIDRLARKVDD